MGQCEKDDNQLWLYEDLIYHIENDHNSYECSKCRNYYEEYEYQVHFYECLEIARYIKEDIKV